MISGGRRHGDDDGDELDQDLELFGIDPDAVRAADQDAPFEVWEENRQVLELFLAVQSQWRGTAAETAEGVRVIWLGLDYAGVDVARRNLRIKRSRDLFEDLRSMEQAALHALNKRAG